MMLFATSLFVYFYLFLCFYFPSPSILSQRLVLVLSPAVEPEWVSCFFKYFIRMKLHKAESSSRTGLIGFRKQRIRKRRQGQDHQATSRHGHGDAMLMPWITSDWSVDGWVVHRASVVARIEGVWDRNATLEMTISKVLWSLDPEDRFFHVSR